MEFIDVELTNFDAILLGILAIVLITQLIIILRIGSFKRQMREMQRNQELVAKHINDVRQGGDIKFADKDLV
jgi:hypothetical protein